MRITQYNLELNDDRHPVLVKEKAVNYASDVKNLLSPQKIVKMCNDIFRMDKLAEETTIMIGMDTAGHPTGVFEISHGTADETLIAPREVFIRLLLSGATCFSLVHNHPSLNMTPSSADISVAKSFSQAGKLMGISLLDFIIIGAGFYSFYEQGILQ